MTARRPGPGGPPGQRLHAVSRTAALWQRAAALWQRIAAVWQRVAAAGQRVAAAGQWLRAVGRTAALWQRIAASGEGQAGLAILVADRAPPRQVSATGPERTAAPGKRLSRRWHGLVEIGHAAVS